MESHSREREREEEVSLTDASTISPPLSLSLPAGPRPRGRTIIILHARSTVAAAKRGELWRSVANCGEVGRAAGAAKSQHEIAASSSSKNKNNNNITHMCSSRGRGGEGEGGERGMREAGERANGHSHADMLSLLPLLLLRPSASSPHNPLNLLARSLWQIIAVSPPHGAIVVVVVAAAAAAQWCKQANFAIKLSSVLEEAESV